MLERGGVRRSPAEQLDQRERDDRHAGDPAPLGFAEDLLGQPNSVMIDPGPRHWGLFARLRLDSGAEGDLVPDAYLAALAIEPGCELITTDRDFARFKGLRWRHPLA